MKLIVGSDLTDWLLSNVKGLSDRRDARRHANNLLKMGYIRHTVNKLNFSEQCYYTIGEINVPGEQHVVHASPLY